MMLRSIVLANLLAAVHSQQVSTLVTEIHPEISWETCTADKNCTAHVGGLTLDSSFREIFAVNTTVYCMQGNNWNTTICYDDQSCAQNCGLNGADYSDDFGVTATGNGLRQVINILMSP